MCNPLPVKSSRWCLTEYSLLLAFVFAFPVVARSQEAAHFAPGVKVLAALTDLGNRGDAWSPNGQRLAYVTADGIWVVAAPDFHQPRRLIRKESGEHHPITQLQWSPDGQQLAFTSSRPGDSWGTLWLAQADGTQVRDLLPPGRPPHSPGTRSVRISTWLSKQEIAFVHGCGTECIGLNTIDEQTGSARHLGIAAGSIYWSPTKTLAVTEEHLGGLGLIDAKLPGIPLAELSSQSPRPALLKGCAGRTPPWQGPEYYFNDWSPDGRQIVYTGAGACESHGVEGSQSRLAAENRLDLYLWEIESNQQKKLVSHAGWAAWSPDGSKIAFLLAGEPSYDAAQRIIDTDLATDKPFPLSLGILEVATRAVVTLVPLGSQERLEGELMRPNRFHPLWSPDGHQVIVPHSSGDLLLIQADGSGWQPLTRDMPATARWSPDGKRLALWRSDADKAFGSGSARERFLPPIGQDDAALSDAEVIDDYFQQALAESSDNASYFLAEYAQALEQLGKIEQAEEQYRSGIQRARASEEGQTGYLERLYASFLCRQGREKEAEEFSGGNLCPSEASPAQRRLMVWQPRTIGQEARLFGKGERGEVQDRSAQERGAAQPISQEQPSLYIVEVPETKE